MDVKEAVSQAVTEKVDIGEALANNYMLAKLNVRIWSGRKTDKSATAELLTAKGAVANAASVVKQLLAGNDAKLKETAAAFTRIRSFFYEATVPWTTASIGAMKGDRLISTLESINFLSDFAKLKNDAITILGEFITEYDNAVQASAVSLGALYDASQYPHKAEIAALFGAEMSLNPLPESTDFDRLTNIPADLATGLKGLYERNMEAQMENALSDIQKRMLVELERMDTQLSKVVAGEKTRLFKSMVTNLKHLTDMARSMNFTDNPAINSIADKIETHLLQHEVESYKDNAALAGDAVRNARDIAADVKDDDSWRVSNDEGDPPATSIAEIPAQPVDSIEPEFTNVVGKSPSTSVEENTQLDEDQEFLASLMGKIEEPVEPEEGKTPEVKEDESEKKPAVSDPSTPEFDEDDIMFSS
jgi:hypothetical protein